MTRREMFIKAGLELMGLPYLWDGKGLPGEPYRGRDCSGFVTERLYAVGGPDMRLAWNTQALWDKLPGPNGPVFPGDLALYETPGGSICHVMVVLGVGDLVFGSAGGDHTTISQGDAMKRGARVQLWESHDPWHASLPFAGYRRFPWLDATPNP